MKCKRFHEDRLVELRRVEEPPESELAQHDTAEGAESIGEPAICHPEAWICPAGLEKVWFMKWITRSGVKVDRVACPLVNQKVHRSYGGVCFSAAQHRLAGDSGWNGLRRAEL
jgi:hypothetical protein